MKFRLVTDDELDQVRNLESAAGEIRRKTKVLIEKLAEQFNGCETGGISGVEFAALDNSRVVGAVKTTFGNGRLRLVWVHDGNQLLGEIVVDREVFDPLDRSNWESVFGISIGVSGGWGPIDKASTPPYYLNGDPGLKHWALGASIYYSILKGPVVA